MGGGCGGSGAAKWVRVGGGGVQATLVPRRGGWEGVGNLVSGAGVVGWMEAW